MPLKDLPPDARPREKLLSRGASALSDAELLALLLRTGIEGKNVIQLAQDIVDQFGGVAGLLHADAKQLMSIKGLGPAKRAELLAVVELARRALAEQMKDKLVLETPHALHDYLRLTIGAKPHEVFAVLFFDVGQRLLATEELFRGSVSEARVYPREVAVRALHHGASAVVLAHNHPSGDTRASPADVALTKSMIAGLGLLDIRVLDHVIVAPGGVFSMQEAGLL
jgi:DNA repair protein RadC